MNLLILPKEKLKHVRAQDHVLEEKEGSKRNQSLLFFVYHCQRRESRGRRALMDWLRALSHTASLGTI